MPIINAVDDNIKNQNRVALAVERYFNVFLSMIVRSLSFYQEHKVLHILYTRVGWVQF